MQYDESKVESGNAKYGGAGYDGKSRPDLSNTQYFLDALPAAGVAKNDPAVEHASSKWERGRPRKLGWP